LGNQIRNEENLRVLAKNLQDLKKYENEVKTTKLIESTMESCPQAVLQSYIMIGLNQIDPVAVISVFLSLLSVSLVFMTMKTDNEPQESFFIFIFTFMYMSSRIFIYCLLAQVLGWYVLCFIIVIYIFTFCIEGDGGWIIRFIIAFINLFAFRFETYSRSNTCLLIFSYMSIIVMSAVAFILDEDHTSVFFWFKVAFQSFVVIGQMCIGCMFKVNQYGF